MLGFKRTPFEKNANEPSWVSCQLSFFVTLLYYSTIRYTKILQGAGVKDPCQERNQEDRERQEVLASAV